MVVLIDAEGNSLPSKSDFSQVMPSTPGTTPNTDSNMEEAVIVVVKSSPVEDPFK